MNNELVLVLDFGGQYKELIARRVRECGVLSQIIPGNTPVEKIAAMKPIGMILTGGPASVYAEDSPKCSPKLFDLGVPVLGICYGHQLMSYLLGGTVSRSAVSEYGKTQAQILTDSPLFAGLDTQQSVLMSHADYVAEPPAGFTCIASTHDCPTAALQNQKKKLFSVQFHPEVTHTENGMKIISNFLFAICGAAADYTMDDYIETQIHTVRQRVGPDGRVLLALSGGVDSSVCAALLSKALGERLVCVFVDHGFMRKNEGDEIEKIFSKFKLTFIRVDAGARFLARLRGITEPEDKRRRIGEEFIRVFEEQARAIGNLQYLAQGTIYPDVIESGALNSATIKSHHNVGGLPERMSFSGIIEPLAGLFKDEVRTVGRKLGLSRKLVFRQPFPGPGLAIRIIGEVTEEKLEILREADAIIRAEIGRSPAQGSQYFGVLTNLRSVGVMGDERTYDYTLAVRAVTTGDFMTCQYARLPHSLLSRISTRVTNEVRGINRVVFDITDKPPATIEWE